MARALRIEYPGALYHITSRGNRQEDIFLSDEDRALFLKVFSAVCLQCDWVCYAYCLMGNHYHLLIETPRANLSKGMHLLNGIYTQKFNRKHKRVGHVFQGRYKGILVEKTSYFLELSRYIVLNPVRAAMVEKPDEWQWSSYRATTQQATQHPWLATEQILSQFSLDLKKAIKKYKGFVIDGMNTNSPWNDLKNQIYLGSEDFVADMQSKIQPQINLMDIPRAQYMPVGSSLNNYEAICNNRDETIRLAYKSGQFSMAEIGNYFGLHYSRVSRIIKNSD